MFRHLLLLQSCDELLPAPEKFLLEVVLRVFHDFVELLPLLCR
jgi:hypothetical protein